MVSKLCVCLRYSLTIPLFFRRTLRAAHWPTLLCTASHPHLLLLHLSLCTKTFIVGKDSSSRNGHTWKPTVSQSYQSREGVSQDLQASFQLCNSVTQIGHTAHSRQDASSTKIPHVYRRDMLALRIAEKEFLKKDKQKIRRILSSINAEPNSCDDDCCLSVHESAHRCAQNGKGHEGRFLRKQWGKLWWLLILPV